jgi:hypothetical protein
VNLNDPSLAIDVRQWRDANLRFDGAAYVFPDGTDFERVRAAIQVAWLAQNYFFALDLACRYGIDSVLCLRCVQRHVHPTNMTLIAPTQATGIPRAAWHSLCDHCCLDLMGVR